MVHIVKYPTQETFAMLPSCFRIERRKIPQGNFILLEVPGKVAA